MENLPAHNSPRVRVIVQARMGSQRLPGKTLALLDNRPLLWHVVSRLQAAARHTSLEWQVHVATSTLAADDPIAAACRQWQVHCFRGDALDVLARYAAAAADLAHGDIVVRATADNPLYCPRRAAAIVEHHLAGRFDYTCIEKLSYVVPEVMTAAALRGMAARGDLDADCHEHVTIWLRRPGVPLRVGQLPSGWHGLRPEIRLTVDTPQELARMRNIMAACGPAASLESVYAWCQRHELASVEHGAWRRSA